MMAVVSALLGLLREKKQTVGFAESCTGGQVAALLTKHAGVSDVFLGGVVSYSNQVKQDLLEVRSETLASFGAVSEETAGEMAAGARKRLRVDWAVAITGIAGPSGGTATKPVGLVCFAVAGPGFAESTNQHFSGDREAVQRQAVEFALKFLADSLRKQ